MKVFVNSQMLHESIYIDITKDKKDKDKQKDHIEFLKSIREAWPRYQLQWPREHGDPWYFPIWSPFFMRNPKYYYYK